MATPTHNIVNRLPISRSEHNQQQIQQQRLINRSINQQQTNQPLQTNFRITNNRQLNLYPSYADQPDILRASQKDEYYKKLFEDQVFEVLTTIIGPRLLINKQSESKLLANTLYYLLTTMLGSQTLGEEYCNLRKIKNKTFSIPNITDRMQLYLFHLLGPYLIKKVLPKLFLKYPKSYVLKEIFPKFERLHLALFYFNGSYFEFSKRLSNIRYIFNRKIDQKRPKYDILGLLIIIQLLLSTFMYLKENSFFLKLNQKDINDNFENIEKIDNNENLDQQESESKCALCLENRTNTTSTICGHLFCWHCITEWCNNKEQCPLCRCPIGIRSCIPLVNY